MLRRLDFRCSERRAGAHARKGRAVTPALALAASLPLLTVGCADSPGSTGDEVGSASEDETGESGEETGETGLPPTLPPLDAPPPTTVQGRLVPATPVESPETELDPRVPEERSMLLAMGYGDEVTAPGEDLLDQTLTGASAPADGAAPRRLTRFVHLADVQLTDDESPTRVAAVDSPGVISASFRPQETYACHALAAIVRTINAYDAEDPYDFVVLGGDNADSAQRNELTWFRDLLDGGVEVHCDSGDDDDPEAGPNNDPKDPLVSEGLRPAWRWVSGNHDILVQGNFTLSSQASIALGDQAQGGTRDWSMPGGPVVTGTIVADPLRELLDEVALMNLMLETSDGHGITAAAVESGKAEYTFDAGDEVRVIVISTAAATGAATGVYRQAQVDSFLRNALDDAEADGKWVIVTSHHASGSLFDGSGLGGTMVPDALTSDQFRDLLGEYPNVIMHLAGHSHVHSARPIGTASGHSYWELRTAAIADHPHQFREIEIWDEDNGFLSIRGVALDYSVEGDPLSQMHRTLGTMDHTSGWNPDDGMGGVTDRNVRLFVPKP